MQYASHAASASVSHLSVHYVVMISGQK